MKVFAMLFAVVVALVAVPAVADDGQVPQPTLRALGLSGIQVATDAQGMQVRGRSSAFVAVKGTSLIFGQLLTPDTKNFVVGSSVNEVDANGETTNIGTITATKDHQVVLFLNLAVTFPDGSTFTGNIGTFDAPAFAAGSGTVSVTLP
jgi:opacity protein-like surface antigen